MFVLPCRNLSFCLRGTLTFGSSCCQNRFAALRCCARYFTWGLGDLVFNYYVLFFLWFLKQIQDKTNHIRLDIFTNQHPIGCSFQYAIPLSTLFMVNVPQQVTYKFPANLNKAIHGFHSYVMTSELNYIVIYIYIYIYPNIYIYISQYIYIYIISIRR